MRFSVERSLLNTQSALRRRYGDVLTRDQCDELERRLARDVERIAMSSDPNRAFVDAADRHVEDILAEAREAARRKKGRLRWRPTQRSVHR